MISLMVLRCLLSVPTFPKGHELSESWLTKRVTQAVSAMTPAAGFLCSPARGAVQQQQVKVVCCGEVGRKVQRLPVTLCARAQLLFFYGWFCWFWCLVFYFILFFSFFPAMILVFVPNKKDVFSNLFWECLIIVSLQFSWKTQAEVQTSV